ncbi:hypothetical protein HAX54_015922, partial [Datura stramonium]|nr:hypothetical protein [Datura stramonium]
VEKEENRKREGQPGGFRRFSGGEGKRETVWCGWAMVRVFPAGLVVTAVRERIVVCGLLFREKQWWWCPVLRVEREVNGSGRGLTAMVSPMVEETAAMPFPARRRKKR